MAKSVFVKNITASGIQIPDLSGIYIEPYSEKDLREHFSLNDIDYSLDLKELIEEGSMILNNGEKDLTPAESLDIATVPTFYELPDTFIKLKDTPFDYDTNKFLRSTISGTEWATISGIGVEDEIFGSEFHKASNELTSSTTSTNYQHKLSLSVSNLPSGTYRIGWFYEWAYSDGNFQFVSRLQINDSINIMEQEIRPAQASISAFRSNSGFGYNDLSGDHTIDLDYCSSKSGKSSYIRKVRIELWRVL